MSSREKNKDLGPIGDPVDRDPVDRDPVAGLVRLAGPRTRVPEDAVSRSRAVVKAAWKESIDHQRRRRRRVWVAAAAVVVVLSAARLLTDDVTTLLWGPGPTLATVEAVTGSGLHGLADPLVGAKSGDHIGTRDGRAALRLSGGASMRLDTETTVALTAEHRLELIRGSIYVDSGPDDAQLAVETPFGTVRDIGTQFEVRLVPEGLRVRVRDGEVEVQLGRAAAGRASVVAKRGTELILDASGREVRREISAHGEPWRRYQAVAPPFELEGATLEGYIRWLTRETGWVIQYEDASIPLEAPTTVLHGSIAEVAVRDTPDIVLPICRLQGRLNGGVLEIHRMSEVTP